MIPDPHQPFYANCDASNFGIGAAILPSHKNTNKTNLSQRIQGYLPEPNLLSTFMKKCKAIKYVLTEYELRTRGSKQPTFLDTDHKPIVFPFTQKSNPNNRVYIFPFILRKLPNLLKVWTAGKNLTLPDTLIRNTTPELITKKTTVKKPQNIIIFF